jgi:hypothetical protein
MPRVEVRPLEPTSYGAAADIVTDALLHDPGRLAVGPDHAGHRRFVARRCHRAALWVLHRYGRPIYGAFHDGRLAGALSWVDHVLRGLSRTMPRGRSQTTRVRPCAAYARRRANARIRL